MKLKFATRKIVALTMAGAVSIAGAGVAFAANESDSQQKSNGFPPQRVDFEKMSGIYQSALDALVEDGTLTQDEADAIAESMSDRGDRAKPEGALEGQSVPAAGEKPERAPQGQGMPAAGEKPDGEQGTDGVHKGPMYELITAGTITQEQADAVMEARRAVKDSEQTLSDVLDELVGDGVLTQDEADAILADMPAKGEKPEGGKQDGEQAGQGVQGEHKSPLSELVTAGTIVQEQADAVNEAVREAMEAARESE